MASEVSRNSTLSAKVDALSDIYYPRKRAFTLSKMSVEQIFQSTNMKSNTYVPLNGHIPEAVVNEVLEDLNNNRTYRQIREDYAVSVGWIHKIKHNKIRK